MFSFFSNQLDFILFFYGLGFILLGCVCFAIARGSQQTMPWAVLGSFAFLHGTGEWLDLTALIVGDMPGFAISRTALMTASFILLLEFARLEAVRLGLKVPGRWVYAPLLLLVGLGAHLAGLNGANAFARYAFGATGAFATSAVLAFHARSASPAERRWIVSAVLGFALYGVAAGIIVPPTPSWEGDFFNYDDFARLTGMPIQFIRGLLACWIAFAIWAFWGQRLMLEAESPRYSRFLHKQFVWTLVAMGTILVFGWLMTEYLGGIYKQNVQAEALGDLDLIASRLSGETATVEGMVKALAGSPAVRSMLENEDRRDSGRGSEILNLDAGAAGASNGYILNRVGSVIASTGQTTPGAAAGNYASAPYFEKAMAGDAGYHFAVEAEGKQRNFYASYPVHGEGGKVIGVAVLKKSLDDFETDLSRFDRAFFLVDPHGIVAVTNRPEMRFRTLWPLSPELQRALSGQFGALKSIPLLPRPVVGSAWITINGERDYVQRRPVSHGDWSLVTRKVPPGIFASRVLGIIITFQMTIMALVYLVGRERWVHDRVQLEKRLELEELARNSDLRAATDPLTGLFNRRKFNRELATEILRAQRYKTPLSLVLYDIDHFKRVNDTHGHQVGDNVLLELSRFVTAHIRNSDVLARWGGEEFVILCPGCNGPMACQLAGNLRDSIRTLVVNGAGTMTCSFGVAQFEDGDTPDSLIARADDALYRAKINGRNMVEFAQQQPAVVSPALQPVA
ncbi:MAG TPA: diguanylate cyclase [Pseudolabrys sp.]|nr:diguanylate cyclase [Pseudolabrys sp.]